jgi:hypothetical protein
MTADRIETPVKVIGQIECPVCYALVINDEDSQARHQAWHARRGDWSPVDAGATISGADDQAAPATP